MGLPGTAVLQPLGVAKIKIQSVSVSEQFQRDPPPVTQANQAARVITVDRKVVEVAGHLYVEAPKNRKCRRTIYPRRTLGGYPLAGKLAARIEAARAEQAAGTNPLGLLFPSRQSSFRAAQESVIFGGPLSRVDRPRVDRRLRVSG